MNKAAKTLYRAIAVMLCAAALLTTALAATVQTDNTIPMTDALGRLNIVYWVKSYADGNQVNINLSRFEGSDRWYVTNGVASTTLFYDQRGALGSTESERQAAVKLAAATKADESTAAQHEAFYSQENPGRAQTPATPFTDVATSGLYADAVAWAYENGVTTGTSATVFGTKDSCTRGQVVTFLWRAAGKPEPQSTANPFRASYSAREMVIISSAVLVVFTLLSISQ